MKSVEHKRAVRTAFSRSAPQYDSVAFVQRVTAQILVQGIPGAPRHRIVDAGSGTGYATRLLAERAPSAQIVPMDHAYAMCAQAKLADTVCGDLESLPFATGCFDLYCANLAWQWTEPNRAAQEAARILRPGGMLAITTLGPTSLYELQTAFAAIDSYRHVLRFRSAEEYYACLDQAGFSEIKQENRILKIHRPDFTTLLRELRTLGANELDTRRRPGLMGRQSWQQVLKRYEALREAQGLPLSYDVLYFYAKKI